MVLISFTPTNPEQLSQTVGFSTNAAFYRKPAGASDAEYVRLDDPDDPPVPLNPRTDPRHHAEVPAPGGARRRVGADRADRNNRAGRPGAGDQPRLRRPVRPACAGSRHGNPSSHPGRRGTDRANRPRDAFVFLDQTVDDGESYIYKIVTLSIAPTPDVEPVPCEAPYVSPEPVFLPSLVEFTVRSDHLRQRQPCASPGATPIPASGSRRRTSPSASARGSAACAPSSSGCRGDADPGAADQDQDNDVDFSHRLHPGGRVAEFPCHRVQVALGAELHARFTRPRIRAIRRFST